MINNKDEIVYITIDGKEQAFKLVKEFENPETKKCYMFYADLDEDATEIIVGEVIKNQDGSKEIFAIDEKDKEAMKYVNEVFEDFLSQLEGEELSEYDEEEESDSTEE